MRWLATPLAFVVASASCLGENGPEEDLDSLLARTPDKGRTSTDPVVPGVLTLTFDDGPGPYTKDIIDTLDRHHVPGTFFLVGRVIAGHRDVLDYAREHGHQLANHSFNHDLQTTLTETNFKHGTLAVHANIHGRDNGRLYFRFPYGAADDTALARLSQVDIDGKRYHPVGWHIDSHDFEFDARYPIEEESNVVLTGDHGSCGGELNPFARDLVGWTQFIARKNRGGIMLFHDIKRITHDKLDQMLTAFEHPEAYWAALPPDLQTTYGQFYECASADRFFHFEFRPLYDGAYPSLRASN